MIIETITYDNSTGLFLVTLNTRETYKISYTFYNESDLHAKDTVSDELLTMLQKEHERETVKQRALTFASYKMRSEGEVREKLLREGYCEENILPVLASLTKMGLLDDVHYAETYVLEKHRRLWSPVKIRQGLFERRISDVHAQNALQLISEDMVLQNLRHLLDKKYKKYTLADPSDYHKVYLSLCRKGYPSEYVLSIINEAREQADD